MHYRKTAVANQTGSGAVRGTWQLSITSENNAIKRWFKASELLTRASPSWFNRRLTLCISGWVVDYVVKGDLTETRVEAHCDRAGDR